MRLTYKKLVCLVNEAFTRLEITNWEAFEAYKTRFPGHTYEGGAATISVNCRKTGSNSRIPDFTLLCFQWREDLERDINNGAVIGIRTCRFGILRDAEIHSLFL